MSDSPANGTARAGKNRTNGAHADDNDLLKAHGFEGLDPFEGLEPVLPAAEEAKREAITERVKDLDKCQLGTFFESAISQMYDRASGKETPVATPWPGLNKMLSGGLWPGLHVLVGNTGAGKSQFALQIAVNAATRAMRAGGNGSNGRNVSNVPVSDENGNKVSNVPVLYVGLELGHTDLVARVLGLLSGERWSDLFLGKDREQLRRATQHYATLRNAPFHLEVCPPMGWDYGALYATVGAMREKYKTGPLLVVLDYLQLVTGEGRELRERIGRASYQARAAARDYGASVILVSSTARDNYLRLDGDTDKETETTSGIDLGNPARLVGMGKESGEIEYAADSVLALANGPWQEGNKSRRINLALAKYRCGPTSWVKFDFDGGRFAEVGGTADPDWEQVNL